MLNTLIKEKNNLPKTFYDCGHDAFARLEVEIEGCADDSVEVAVGEVLQNGRIHRNPGGYRTFRSRNITLKQGTHRYRFEIASHQAPDPALPKCPSPEGGEVVPFRYVEVTGRAKSVRIFREVVSGDFDDHAADFRCDHAALQEVWDFCRYSIKSTLLFGKYIDGERERLPYEGDAYINQLGHFCCDADYRVARNTLEHFFAHPTWPTEWRLLTPILMRDYVLYSGDRDFAKLHQAELEATLLLPYLASDGLLHGNPLTKDIVDWPQGERDNYEFGEANSVPNAYLYGALQAMDELYGSFHEKAMRFRRAFRQAFFHQGLVRDSLQSSHHSLHSSMFALRFGLAEAHEVPLLADHMVSRGMGCSVYGAQFLLESAFLSGRAGHAVGLMTSDGLRSWRNMLAKGATISMEAWDDSLKPNQDWTHAWGAAPANIVTRHLCGIRPSAPGFRLFTVEPQSENIAFSVRQPTTSGPITLEWDGAKGKLCVPPGCRAMRKGETFSQGIHRIV